jgi:hypothetical protein
MAFLAKPAAPAMDRLLVTQRRPFCAASITAGEWSAEEALKSRRLEQVADDLQATEEEIVSLGETRRDHSGGPRSWVATGIRSVDRDFVAVRLCLSA